MRRRLHAWPLVAALASAQTVHAAEELRNWFDDPFFQVSQALADCPLPAGPFVDERRRREQAHRRAEKGTTCWLAGNCDRPKAYDYDADIARDVRNAFAAAPSLTKTTTLWITVQGRVVYVEGCARSMAAERAIERMVRSLPHVQQAIAIVRTEPHARRRTGCVTRGESTARPRAKRERIAPRQPIILRTAARPIRSSRITA